MASTGIPLALLATTAYNSGLILEKRALEQLPAIDMRRTLSLVRTVLMAPQWLAGFSLMLCGLAFQVIVFTFEPVTVVQPVIACGVVVVLLLSRLVLREHLGSGEFGCVAVMGVSVILLGLSTGGPATGSGHHASTFAMAVTAIPSCALGLLIAASALRAASRKHRAPVIGMSYGIGAGLLYGVAALAIKAMSGILTSHHSIVSAAIAFASSPYLYVMAGCSAAGLLLFQTALQRCRAAIVVPVSNIAGSVYFMVAGTWLFHEHLPAEPSKLVFRLTGILAACSVLFLLPRQTAAPKPVTGPALLQRR
ncbi:MAG: DMT family transporter [Micromonosporaceae bacterium]